MLPRWHIFFGAIFTWIIWKYFPETSLFYLSLVFLSSFLIDFDHYVNAVIKTGKLSLFEAFEYHRITGKIGKKLHEKGIRKKGDFHLFHTVEFHALIGILGIFWPAFMFIFIGMIFHSILDIISMIYMGYFYAREFFLINWIGKKI